MEVPYSEGLANHAGPESCVGEGFHTLNIVKLKITGDWRVSDVDSNRVCFSTRPSPPSKAVALIPSGLSGISSSPNLRQRCTC